MPEMIISLTYYWWKIWSSYGFIHGQMKNLVREYNRLVDIYIAMSKIIR